MATSEEDLRRVIARLRGEEEGTAYAFVYCASDADGQPQLLVSPRRVDPRAMFALRRSAKDPALTRGTVSWSEADGFRFEATTAVHPSFTGHLGLIFRHQAPGLRRSAVVAAG